MKTILLNGIWLKILITISLTEQPKKAMKIIWLDTTKIPAHGKTICRKVITVLHVNVITLITQKLIL